MIFGKEYAGIYDSLYDAQHYKAEAMAVVALSGADGNRPTLLDLGCGTGNHTQHFKNHFDVTGVDLSEAMLEIARQKCPGVAFEQGDARSFRLGRKFDVVTMMSAVLGYQVTNEAILDTLRNVHTHLNPGGIFIFDVWNGPAILMEKMIPRLREYESGGLRLVRSMEPALDAERNVCTCRYKWWVPQDGALTTHTEYHTQRYFFVQEMKLFLDVAGFDLVRTGKPGHNYRPPEVTDRDIMFVARAR